MNDGGIAAKELAIVSDEITCSHLLNYIAVFGQSVASNVNDIGAVVCMNSPNVHSYLTPQGANKVELLLPCLLAYSLILLFLGTETICISFETW